MSGNVIDSFVTKIDGFIIVLFFVVVLAVIIIFIRSRRAKREIVDKQAGDEGED